MRRLAVGLVVLVALVAVPSGWAGHGRSGETCSGPTRSGPIRTRPGSTVGSTSPGAEGETVRSPARGVVSFAGSVPGSGRTVTIQAEGYAVSLTHLAAITTSKGATVAEGGALGVAGQSGGAEWPSPYVHLGIRVSAAADGYVDPQTLLPPRAVVPPPPATQPVGAAWWLRRRSRQGRRIPRRRPSSNRPSLPARRSCRRSCRSAGRGQSADACSGCHGSRDGLCDGSRDGSRRLAPTAVVSARVSDPASMATRAPAAPSSAKRPDGLARPSSPSVRPTRPHPASARARVAARMSLDMLPLGRRRRRLPPACLQV